MCFLCVLGFLSRFEVHLMHASVDFVFFRSMHPNLSSETLAGWVSSRHDSHGAAQLCRHGAHFHGCEERN